MDFIKKNYEKVLLSVVLLGLAVAAAALPVQVAQVRGSIDETVSSVVRTNPKEFRPVDDYLSTNQALVRRLNAPADVQLAGFHNVFNPVKWQQGPDGSFIKVQTGNEVGPYALVITNIQPLQLIVSFDAVNMAADVPRYSIGFIRETDTNPRKVGRIAEVRKKNDLFTLHDVEGPVESPTAVSLLLEGDRDTIKVSRDEPFTRVIGYAADLAYPPARQTFNRRRVNDTIRLEGDPETYKIVAITPTEVVLSAQSTQKPFRVKYTPSP
jgi:hypothetical protein